MDKLLKLHEAATLLGLSDGTVRNMTFNQVLPCSRTPAGHRRIPLNAVLELVKIRNIELPREYADKRDALLWRKLMRFVNKKNWVVASEIQANCIYRNSETIIEIIDKESE